MIDKEHVNLLKKRKNLLAFSAGVDSSALLFLLLEHDIPFDIAMVNYRTREASDREEAHAMALSKAYGFKCFTAKAPKFESHFEAQARKFRYNFFEEIMQREGHEMLLTAHQLNDQLEWFLMRLSKGAGVSELTGLEPVTQKEGYSLIRPLLEYSKEELLEYLKEKEHPYFIDESNQDEKYERNRFRKSYSDPLISKYKEGIKRSFHYLRLDKKILEEDFETSYSEQSLRVITLHRTSAKVKAVDLAFKNLGYLLSASQRLEVEKENSLVIGGTWVIERQGNLLYIAPYVNTNMTKAFKEACRILQIPAKIRPYLFETGIDITHISNN